MYQVIILAILHILGEHLKVGSAESDIDYPQRSTLWHQLENSRYGWTVSQVYGCKRELGCSKPHLVEVGWNFGASPELNQFYSGGTYKKKYQFYSGDTYQKKKNQFYSGGAYNQAEVSTQADITFKLAYVNLYIHILLESKVSYFLQCKLVV